jgi:hypothetical protein
VPPLLSTRKVLKCLLSPIRHPTDQRGNWKLWAKRQYTCGINLEIKCTTCYPMNTKTMNFQYGKVQMKPLRFTIVSIAKFLYQVFFPLFGICSASKSMR